jgi:hypothetical protein
MTLYAICVEYDLAPTLIQASGQQLPTSVTPVGGAGGPGSTGYVIWRPGVASAGQAVATWAEVMTAIGNGAERVYVDSSIAAATTPGTGQTYEFSMFVGFSPFRLLGFETTGNDTMTIADTDVLQNVRDFTGNLTVVCECTTTACFNWTDAEPEPQVNFAVLYRPDTATASAFKAADGQFFSPAIAYGGQIERDGGNTHGPFFGADSGGFLFPFLFTTAAFYATSFGNSPGSTLGLFYDDTCFPIGAALTPTFAAGTFFASPLSNDQQQAYGTGTTFPAEPKVGQPFLRTDLNAMFRYSGENLDQGGDEQGWTSPGNVGFVQTTDALPTAIANLVPGDTTPELLVYAAVQCNQSGRVVVRGSWQFECSAADAPTISVRILNSGATLPSSTGGTNIQNASTQAGAFVVATTPGSPVVPTPDPSTGTFCWQGTVGTETITGDNLCVVSFEAEFGSAAIGDWLAIGVYGVSTSETTQWNINTPMSVTEKPN